MSDYKKNVDHKINGDPMWGVFKDRYNKHFFNYRGHKPDVIPKKIHQVWVGSSLPDGYKRLIQTWRDKHPTWEYKLWTDEDLKGFGLVNQHVYDAMGNMGAKADIFRYEILYRYGGIYADTDFECIRPFDDLRYLDFFAGNGWTEDPNIFNGLFAARPFHPLLKRIIEAINPISIAPHDRHQEVMQTTGPCFFSQIMSDYMRHSDDKIVVFPKNFFYPCSTEIRFDLRDDTPEARELSYKYITDRTYCIHLWYTSWVPEQWRGTT